MKNKTYLMSFERVIQLIEGNGRHPVPSRVPSHPPVQSRLFCVSQSTVISNEVIERLVGTWWEVELSDEGEILRQCRYLADSLQDALRLRPNIDISYWCIAGESKTYFLTEITNWVDDCYEMDEGD